MGRFISKDSVEGDITNPLTLNRYAYCAGNPIIYIDPTGNTTEWDYRNVTNPQDLAFIDALGKAWQDATNQETRDFAHACAEFIRDKYRGPNEYGLKDGNTITINNKKNGIDNTAQVVKTVVDKPGAWDDFCRIPSTFKESVSDTWAEPNTKQAIKNTGITLYDIIDSAVYGFLPNISSGDPEFDEARKRVADATFYSPSNAIKWFDFGKGLGRLSRR